VESQIAEAINYIQAGDVFQANISARFSGQLEPGDTPFDLFSRLMGRHPSPFAAYLCLGGKVIASHSPERFMSRTASGLLETRPIKGTTSRHKDPIQDARNAQMLLASQKDRAEKLMIVDLMRNDIARVCEAGSVKVPRLCDLESFSTVHHLVSEVRGQQKPGLGFFDALRSSFPPGSITGAPKVRAMEIISELEGEPRGPWCGSMIRVGFDGAADSNVLIRTAVCQKQDESWQIDARAGAGIVADSEPSQEYEEILVKARALRIAAHSGDVL
jgi:para-aminobenzoate synthetase component 1